MGTTTVAGVDHTVVVDELTGSARVQVPVPTTAARALTPRLVLQGGGGGNSIVGLGWSIGGLPAITIDASEHLPRWEGRDAVALGGAGLVAWRDDDGVPRRRVEGDHDVTELRPGQGFTRVRVEQWLHRATGDVHFRSRDDADVLTIYGARLDRTSRIFDPRDPTRVAAWLPELVLDADGNAMWCEYAAEDTRGVDRAAPWEPRQPSTAQRYLTRIRYGNVAPVALTDALIGGQLPTTRFAFALVVDHGDHGDGGGVPTFEPDRPWLARTDSFSSARDGFVVHTHRRVRRLACFHDVVALGPAPVAVSSLELVFDEHPGGTRLESVRRVGHRDGAIARTAALTFGYAAAGLTGELATTATPVPQSARHRLIDLYGEGLPGLLYQGERGWSYRSNLGGGRFAEPALVGAQPNFERAVTLGDLDRDGDTELAVVSGRQAGAFALEREDARWVGFRPFARWPRIEGLAGRTFWVDLNGDGRADAVVARGDALIWFPSRTGPLDERDAEFDDPVIVPWPSGVERAPGAPDPALDLYFADLTGDGLPDLVRVRRGAIEYWPSLGNGRFGERVVMEDAPSPASANDFDSTRVRWVDLDGRGTAGLLYVDDGGLWYYPNQGGRRFGAGQRVRGLPHFDARAASVADLIGDGRPALVWPSPEAGRTPVLCYLPLVPATPPGLLVSVDDGRGRRTELTWASSAKHYLRDAAEGAPWETRLPAHRPVVETRVDRDLVGGTSVTTRYRYRDGFYDGAAGAFRGFGRVETLDTAAAAHGDSEAPAVAAPLLTRTWFHLGTPMWNHHRPFEPYAGDPLAPELPPHVEAPGPHLSADAAAALRLLAGTIVRRERWAVDEHERPVAHPFDVEQACARLAVVQPRHGGARPVFGVVPAERLVARYDEHAGDPRITHDLVVTHDAWGAPTRTAQIAYARRGAVDDPAQARTWVTVTDAVLANIDKPAQLLLGAPIETRRHELVGVAAVGGRIRPAALASASVTAALAAPASFETALDPSAIAPAARRIAWQRTYYWNDARDGAASPGELGRAPRVHHGEEACLTSALVAAAFGGRTDDAEVASLGYALADRHAWRPAPIQRLVGPFAMLAGTLRGDGAITGVTYDADWLAAIETVDALGLSTTSDVDYHALSAARTVDPNGTAGLVAFDPLGRAVARGVLGHVGTQPWGSGPLGAWTAPPLATLASVLADPGTFLGTAASATWLDDRAWEERGVPIAEVSIERTALGHDGDGGGDAGGPLEIAVRYLDGFGRVLQEKVRVEPGPAITRDAGGQVIVDANGPLLGHAAERWRVSGHVVHDAKGQPIRVFEPYFSPAAAYEDDVALERFGVSTLTTYDALGRAVRVDLPDGTYARTRYAPWATEAASPGDTVLDSTYRALRERRPAGDPERVAYEHAASHANTPTVTHVDARGLVCLTVAVGDASAAERRARQVVDASGQVIATIDPRGLTAFTYQRDLRGRALATVSVDAGPSWSLPDAYDRPARAWDARGYLVARGFDAADRPTMVRVIGGDGPVPLDHVVESYLYGDRDADREAARAANTLGRVVEVRDGAGVTRTLTYDPMGAVRAGDRRLRLDTDDTPDWRTDLPVDADPLASAVRTDALARVVWQRLPDGTERRDAFHPGGALASVRLTTPDGALVDAPITVGIVRDAHRRIAADQLGNRCVQAWQYDRDTGRLIAQDAQHGTRALQRLRFTYDPDGKVVRALDLAQDGPGAVLPSPVSARRDYRYDAHGRLLEATGRVHQALLPHDDIPGTAGTIGGARHLSLDNGAALERYTQRFTYDASGNLRRVQHAGSTASWSTDFWVADGSNRSISALDPAGVPVVDPAAHFDAAGNTVALAHLRSIAWSWRGCLTRAVTIARPGSVDDDERYAYGADRMRARKLATRLVAGGSGGDQIETREVVYVGDQERVRVRRNGALVLERWTTHVGDGDRRVAVVDRHTLDTLGHEVDALGPARVRYHLTTPQGSTSLELDEAGGLISYEEYLPHGGGAFIAGDDARDVARRDLRYASQERDRATGLHAYPFRYYAPWLGRWLSPDPIGPKDDLNLYQFVNGDPIANIDPLGLEGHHWWTPIPDLPVDKPDSHEPARPSPSLSDVGGAVAKAGALLGDLASKAGDRETLTYFNYQIDANHDRVITSDELSHLDGLGGPSQQDWLFAMAFHQGAGYQVDDTIGAKFDSAMSARITPLRGDAVGLGSNPDFTNDTNPRIGEDGTIYRRSEERQAGQREIHKYEDPHRIDATIKVAVYGLAPEVAAVWESFKAGLEIGQAINGRDLSGNQLSADQRGAKAFAGVLGLGQAAILRMSGGQTKGALDDLLNAPSAAVPRPTIPTTRATLARTEATAETAAAGVESTAADLTAPTVTPRGARGPTSGRDFNPLQAGGPVRQLSTDRVRVTPRGVENVEVHLERFGSDPANQVMIERLRSIARAEIEATPQDLNFYTHELRESVRYRRLGWPSGDPGYGVWNNAHTATLEDYGLSEQSVPHPLYHPDALKAAGQ